MCFSSTVYGCGPKYLSPENWRNSAAFSHERHPIVDLCPWSVQLLTLLDTFLEPSPNSPNIFVVESSTAHRKHRVTSHDPMLLVWHCDHGGCTLPLLNCANQSWITMGITRPTSYPLVKMPEEFSFLIFQIFTILDQYFLDSYYSFLYLSYL